MTLAKCPDAAQTSTDVAASLAWNLITNYACFSCGFHLKAWIAFRKKGSIFSFHQGRNCPTDLLKVLHRRIRTLLYNKKFILSLKWEFLKRNYTYLRESWTLSTGIEKDLHKQGEAIQTYTANKVTCQQYWHPNPGNH